VLVPNTDWKPEDLTGKTQNWQNGTYDSPEESLLEHFKKHGKEVGAKDPLQYLNKALGFSQNLRRASKHDVEGATKEVKRYKKNGKYIDLTYDGGIISFGCL
jgi:pyocin large subunit-like protein